MRISRRKYKISELFILGRSILKVLLNPGKMFNLLLAKVSFFFKLEKCLGLPPHINIEPTASCNYQCVKCEKFSDVYRDDGMVFKGKNMPFEHYCRIIDDIGDTLLTLRLWNYGEPLMNKDIFKMIKYAKKKDIIVVISSNLSLLTKESAGELIRSGLDYLVVSFDGASKETYSLCHGRDYFDEVVKNIKSLIEAKKKMKSLVPLVELQFIVMKENEKEIDKIRILAAELGVDKVSCLKFHKHQIEFNKLKGIKLEERYFPTLNELSLNKDEIIHLSFFNIPWELPLIRYSGLVLPWDGDLGQEWKMGNLFQGNNYLNFKSIWNNDKYCDFRRKITKNINGINICLRGCRRYFVERLKSNGA